MARLAQMDEYDSRFGRRLVDEDFLAAGFTPQEVQQYRGANVQPSLTPEDRAAMEAQYGLLQAPDYTMRQTAANRAQDRMILEGVDPYVAGLYSRRIFGDTAPTDGGLGIGLADLTPLGIPFGIEEGSRTVSQGYQQGDPVQMGLGALEAGMGLLEATPLTAAIGRGITKTVSRMDPNTLYSVFGPPVGNTSPVRAAETGGSGGGGLLSPSAGSVGTGGRVAPNARASDWIDDLRSRYPGVKIDVSGGPDRGYIVSRIVVPESSRSQGIGSQIMREISDIADSQGATIALTPSSDFGGRVSRLRDFYSRLGFVRNSGRNRDMSISEEMYREPISSNRSTATGLLASAAETPAQRMAREILDLRAAGRAGEVTEEMMAQADPQYMFDNTPLPMDYASRVERASRFNDTGYHGTVGDYANLRPSVTGKLGPGIYTAPEPNLANSFAGKIYGEEEYLEGGNVMPLVMRSNPAPDMFRSEASSLRRSVDDPFTGADLFTRYLDDLGFTGVKVNSEQTTLDPRNVRSRFARFDPEFRHLPNLNAAIASPLLGLFALMAAEEQRNGQQY